MQKTTPLARWALRNGVTREVALRKGFRGEISMVQVDGRWFIVAQWSPSEQSEPVVTGTLTRRGAA